MKILARSFVLALAVPASAQNILVTPRILEISPASRPVRR